MTESLRQLNDSKKATEKLSYVFDELTLEAQEVAIKNRARYWIKCLSVDEVPLDCNYYKAYLKCEEMKAPWLFVDKVAEYCRDEIIKEIATLKFNSDGEIENGK